VSHLAQSVDSPELSAAEIGEGLPAAMSGRCAIDTVEVARIERLLRETPAEDLPKLFSERELGDSGEGPGRAASLAARFAAKEACLKLFPRETALGTIQAHDFAVERNSYGAPEIVCSPAGAAVVGRHRIARIAVSLTHDRTRASAVALAEPAVTPVPLLGKVLYHVLPFRRRVILGNLRRVFGDTAPDEEIQRLAQAHYAHLGRVIAEFFTFSWQPAARRTAAVRVENSDVLRAAAAQGRGVLVLTGHFGSFEVVIAGGIAQYEEIQGRLHLMRRRFKPRWLEQWMIRRALRSGIRSLPKRGSLENILQRLEAGDVVVFPFDQHADKKDGIRVEFFGHATGTFRSLAILARATGAPVVPASAWREAPGRHVLRFEQPLAWIECEDYDEEIRRNTREYNAALERLILRHPEQWWWAHRRWRGGEPPRPA
jgi:KDO2-lipid IV(A) lauroyltransferase